MRFTEGMFKAHRANFALGRTWDYEHGLPLPSNGQDLNYTDCSELFGDDWLDPCATRELQGLKVVVVLAFTQSLPDLRFDREWLAILHQCGGHASDPMGMIGTRLRPRASVAGALLRIARDRYGEDYGWFCRNNIRASQIVSYSAALSAIGLDCERSWRYLQEGTYPIDATQRNLDQLAEDAPDLRALAHWKERAPGWFRPDPVILALCEDSQ